MTALNNLGANAQEQGADAAPLRMTMRTIYFLTGLPDDH